MQASQLQDEWCICTLTKMELHVLEPTLGQVEEQQVEPMDCQQHIKD